MKRYLYNLFVDIADPLEFCPAEHPYAIELPGRACCKHELADASCASVHMNITEPRTCCPNGDFVSCQGRICKNFESEPIEMFRSSALLTSLDDLHTC